MNKQRLDDFIKELQDLVKENINPDCGCDRWTFCSDRCVGRRDGRESVASDLKYLIDKYKDLYEIQDL